MTPRARKLAADLARAVAEWQQVPEKTRRRLSGLTELAAKYTTGRPRRSSPTGWPPTGCSARLDANSPDTRPPPRRVTLGARGCEGRKEETMRVLIACEFSGIVRDAFAARGHDAWSCDLLPTERAGQHIQGDAIEAMRGGAWDILIAHPPCTYLSRAGARWWKDAERQKKADAAAEFVFALRDAPIEKICIENPIGQLNRRWRYPDQTIQPWQFGHPYSKATCLWLKNLPFLRPTKIIDKYTPFMPSNTGWNSALGRSQPMAVRDPKIASVTFKGVAQAMAEQWG